MTYEDIKRVNESIIKTKLINEKTGKELGDYAEVNERIKAFRMLYPEGSIKTEMISYENGVCIFKASIYKNYELVPFAGEVKLVNKLLATGTAYEKENSSFINKTSYIENCETSAVGRALAMLGIGIEKSVTSAEEVANAILNQEEEVTEETAKAYTFGGKKHPGETIEEVYNSGDIKFLEWCLYSDKTSEFLKKAIELLTPVKRVDKEEQTKRLELIKKVKDMYAFGDMEQLKEDYHVSDISLLTTEELEALANE